MKSAFVGLVGLAVLLPSAVAVACGGGDESSYDDTAHPDVSHEAFAAGRLGLLRGSLRTRYLVYSWRTMMGIPTTPDEQKHVVEGWRNVIQGAPHQVAEWGSQQWTAARSEVVPQREAARLQFVLENNYAEISRIHADAFVRAASTARVLAKEWKSRPALLEEWVRNQDVVFGECGSLMESTPGIEMGLKPREKKRRQSERAYQEAASLFYCNNFDAAAAAFQAIADASDSPYRALGAYLVARTAVRRALFEQHPESSSYERKVTDADRERFALADQAIAKVLADPKLREVHGPARRLQSLVRTRLDAQAWNCELLTRVLEPGTGSGLSAQLGDLPNESLDGSTCSALPPPAAELVEWFQSMKSFGTEENTRAPLQAAAVAHWRKTAHLPWLVAALMLSRADSPGLPQLLADAEKVPLASSAGLTLAYHSVHLLRERGDLPAARARLDAIPRPPAGEMPYLSALLRMERFDLAQNWEEVLQTTTVEYPQPTGPVIVGLSENAWRLESRLTARKLKAWSETVPQDSALRRRLAWNAFGLACVVGDDETLQAVATSLAGTEPLARAELLAIVGRPTPEERLFDARFLLMGLPAVSARLTYGRDITTSPTYDLTEDIRRGANGWCAVQKEVPVTPPFSFETPEERAAAAAEWKALTEAGGAVAFHSRVALAWAQAHPKDPRSPIALFRAVRASKNGCGQNTPEARKAFSYLHKHYGKTEWAKKVRYVY
ncbi:hypothetical protein [Corallococcus terminator]|uniref:DUF4034 domain-containing protein n=1 Tax=Corallococcus terminator TaxID=2316733 RepID=A0A3A8JHS7_9BACT|nr:hypothetical protein [Corallococcus terminator]RKG91874.1 hypothetical protein D7V88_08130 [Corallococcus terminator]